MSLSNSLREQIDCQPFQEADAAACAPIDAGEGVAEVVGRSQQFDRKVAQAMRACEPPANFADRMLESLAISADVAEEESKPALPSRRSWLRAGIIGGVCVVAATIAAVAFFSRAPLKEEELIQLANGEDGWLNEVYNGQWNENLADAKQQRPYDRNDLRRNPLGWRSYPVSLDAGAIVYDLRESNFDTQAVLFAIRPSPTTEVAYTTPPPSPQNRTGVWTIAAWQRESDLFVLACHGGPARYRKLVHQLETAGYVPAGGLLR